MCTCLYFVVEQIHFSTPSVGYNCYTSGFCICIFCVFRGWINTCLYTVTQCFMYGVWFVWCIHDGFSLYGYRCLSSQIWIYADCKVLHHIYIFIVFKLWFKSIRLSGRLHCVIVYLHIYSLSHFDVVFCLRPQTWIYMLEQHLRYSTHIGWSLQSSDMENLYTLMISYIAWLYFLWS